MNVERTFRIAFSVVVFILSLATLWHVVEFISLQEYLSCPIRAQNILSFFVNYEKESYFSGDGEHPSSGAILFALLVDAALVALFVIQHSLMAAGKERIKRYGPLRRSFYVLATVIVLQITMFFWRPTPSAYLWHIETQNNSVRWWTFAVLHWGAWVILYGGCILMDCAELFGLKQAYYSAAGLGDPLMYKSEDLQLLYSHMRHPSFSGIMVLLWCHPAMTLDRMLLSISFTVYMILCFTVDAQDYTYQRANFYRKHLKLEAMYKQRFHSSNLTSPRYNASITPYITS